ncbi:uncharacterized protein LAESUDRAFT_386706 [Laetiporus sulphureus 93-53]|uniref:Coiled-coil domain-containing protein 16 n=1 Tax=Laetiporus sulphureus 93-53 TaxID=1314785 RepID=A0A165CJ43_9APHY|nr:uncharacterized protein LAESUDRAFT_386706 [Laetiporus sulphureus 93-53]KZT02901.1 hypothetical protein LAESUDRAFT_386706 [Laetiporus sulphureus 93-53]
MTDVRSLLKAKRQEVRVKHPLVSYTASGQLRCIACGIVIKQGTSWDGHVGSKAHRINAVHLKEQRQRQEMEREEALLRQKRKADEEPSDEENTSEDSKRRKVDGTDEEERIPSPSGAAPVAETRFPQGFFSDLSRAPPPSSSQESDDDETMSAPATAARSAIDEEWEKFQAAVINAPDVREMYDRATVVAEPFVASNVPEGFPSWGAAQEDGTGPAERSAMLNEAELRRRKEHDERELIMDRLLEEERAQEEADAKVTMLKSRLDALKRQRQAARAQSKSYAQK